MLALSLASFAAVASLVVPANAHMEMTYPPPFRSKQNPHTTEIEYSMTSPLLSDGSNYPCKGFLSDYNTPAGASVADWNAGGNYHFTLQGGATHNGGSCQALLSYDQGKTFTVIKSLIGACPVSTSPVDYDVTVPADAPTGDAIFAWTWFNNLGNREMYMNCAHITIKGGNGNAKRNGPAFSERPGHFVANVGNGCTTTEGSDLDFPNPGPDVINSSGKTAPPSGNCEAGPGSGGNTAPQSSAAPPPSSSEGAPAPASSSASFDDGQWRPETSSSSPDAAATPSSSSADKGQWQPEPTASSADNGQWKPEQSSSANEWQSAPSSSTVNPPTESGKNRKKKCVRRQKRNQHHRRAGPHGGRSRNF